MKHLQDIVLESLLDDEDEIFDKGKYSGLISRIFSKSIDERRLAFSDLESLIESYNPKQHKSTAKMKSSDSYFIEFTRPVKIENHEATEILDWISYIQICKRKGLSYTTVCFNAGDSVWNKEGSKINVYEANWNYTRANFAPHSKNTKLYEVPEELNDLFKTIQAEARKYK